MNSPNSLTITCSRFDANIVDYTNEEIKKIKYTYISKPPRIESYLPISCDGIKIYDGKKTNKIDDFFNTADKKCKFIVLTDKEVKFTIQSSTRHDIEVFSFESRFPIFSEVRYVSDITTNFNYLQQCLKKIKSMGIHESSIPKCNNHTLLKVIERKIYSKTNLDKYFAHAYLPPYQEVFIFSEFRPDRKVIALDFNSMFASCMKGQFLEPKSVFYKKILSTYDGMDLEPGLYRVLLNKPKESFFRCYHPFKFSKLNSALSFNLESNHQIEIQLFSFEVKYYSKFFESTEILSGLLSRKTIGHPLYKESRRLYKLRISAKEKNNKPLERLYKTRLAMLHSLTNLRCLSWRKFFNTSSLQRHLHQQYGIKITKNIGFYLAELNNSKNFNFSNCKNGLLLSGLHLNGSSSIYSFSAQVIAMSRLKIIEQIEYLLNFEDLELCYINTDSIHISLPTHSVENFMDYYGHMISDSLGKIKIQAIGDAGVWFDVGHYFIMENKKVIQFKNAVVNHKGNSDPFIDNRIDYRCYKSKNFQHAVKRILTFKSSLTYKKELEININHHADNIGVLRYRRFNYFDISDFEKLTFRQNKEILSSSRFKYDFYLKLKSFYKY